MPWQERSIMEQRAAFVHEAQQEGANITALCRDYAISRPTAYRWLERAMTGEPLSDRSRRPTTSPQRTSAAMEQRIVALRQQHPAWGGRKLRQRLGDLGIEDVPAASTITAILRRQGQLVAEPPRRDHLRFEHSTHNELWQMDYMGHRALDVGRVHPLTVLDDHSRFALLLAACANEQLPTVQAQLTTVFRRYGLPRAILCDHGSPWAPMGAIGLTRLEAWLLQIGVEPWHGRPRHPQTQGKVERFHRTIAAEVFRPGGFPSLAAAQAAFDAFRTCYNQERPHEALGLAVPQARYAASPRPFPEQLPAIDYPTTDMVLTVTQHGSLTWQGRRHFISRGLVGQPVGIRPTAQDGCWAVYFCQRQVATIDLTVDEEV